MEELISGNDPDLSRDITWAAFQSVGIVPVLRDKLIIWVKGLPITPAEFFNIPGRKFSTPEELFRLRFFSSLMICPSGITLNPEFSCVGWMLHMTGLFQTRSESWMNVFFKVRTSSVKKLQIVLGMNETLKWLLYFHGKPNNVSNTSLRKENKLFTRITQQWKRFVLWIKCFLPLKHASTRSNINCFVRFHVFFHVFVSKRILHGSKLGAFVWLHSGRGKNPFSSPAG